MPTVTPCQVQTSMSVGLRQRKLKPATSGHLPSTEHHRVVVGAFCGSSKLFTSENGWTPCRHHICFRPKFCQQIRQCQYHRIRQLFDRAVVAAAQAYKGDKCGYSHTSNWETNPKRPRNSEQAAAAVVSPTAPTFYFDKFFSATFSGTFYATFSGTR